MQSKTAGAAWPKPRRAIPATVLEAGGSTPSSATDSANAGDGEVASPAEQRRAQQAAAAASAAPPLVRDGCSIHHVPAAARLDSLDALRSALCPAAAVAPADAFAATGHSLPPKAADPPTWWTANACDDPTQRASLRAIREEALALKRGMEGDMAAQGSNTLPTAAAVASFLRASVPGFRLPSPGATDESADDVATALTPSSGSLGATVAAVAETLRLLDPNVARELTTRVQLVTARAQQRLDEVDALRRAGRQAAAAHGSSVSGVFGGEASGAGGTGPSSPTGRGGSSGFNTNSSVSGATGAPASTIAAAAARVPIATLAEYEVLLHRIDAARPLAAEVLYTAGRLRTLQPVHDAALRNEAALRDAHHAARLAATVLAEGSEQVVALRAAHESGVEAVSAQVAKLRARAQALKA